MSFDMGNLGAMFGNFQRNLEELREKLAQTEVEGSAGDGMVTIRMSCNYEVRQVRIDPEAAEDTELMEDLLRAAFNEAVRKVQEEMSKSTGALTAGLPIPPGMIPGL